jgi:hypothetical protein
MLVTKEQQEAVLDNYIRQGKSQGEVMGFIDGMEAMFNLIAQIQIRVEEEKIKYLNKP